MDAENEIVLKTNMTCDSCVSKVEPQLHAQGITKNLRFDMASPDKTVQFIGGEEEKKTALRVLKKLGYDASVVGAKTSLSVTTSQQTTEESKPFLEAFKPLLIIALFLIGTTALVEIKVGIFDYMRAMSTFMGAFFIVFSFFKFIDIEKFVDAFGTYDLIGKKSRIYALSYPFIELFLGISFVLHVMPVVVNLLTIFLMLIGSIGVWKVLRKKQVIQCACLGTIFNLPMTKVTLFENTLMLAMSIVMLWNELS